MTRRAEVWQDYLGAYWIAAIDHEPQLHTGMRDKRIRARRYALEDQDQFDTHAEALAYAIRAVGLAPHTEDCDCSHCCTHEISAWGICAGWWTSTPWMPPRRSRSATARTTG